MRLALDPKLHIRVPPRHQPQVDHRRYSRFVALMKIALPSAAAVLLAVLVAWPKITAETGRFAISAARISTKEVETLSMLNARFQGVDAANKPYTITSDVATEEAPKSGIVSLKAPKADFTTKSGNSVLLDAENGIYYQNDKLLDLIGGVSVFHDKGYEIHTNSARVDMAHNTAWGHEYVHGHGPQGTIESEDGFQIKDQGKDVVFSGRAKMMLNAAHGISPAAQKTPKKKGAKP